MVIRVDIENTTLDLNFTNCSVLLEQQVAQNTDDIADAELAIINNANNISDNADAISNKTHTSLLGLNDDTDNQHITTAQVAVVDDVKSQEFTLDNDIVNGDFSDGTNGWLSSNSTHLVTDNNLYNTNSGVSNSSLECQDTNISLNITDKLFFYGKLRVTNDQCAELSLRARGNGGGTKTKVISIATPNENQWYELYGSFNLASDNTGTVVRMYFYHTYDTAEIANGKVMEIDGNTGIYAINMTELGIEDYTAEEMKLLIDQIGYFEGETTVKQSQIMKWYLAMIRQNREAIITLGGSL